MAVYQDLAPISVFFLPKQYFLRVSGSMNLGSPDLTISSSIPPGSLLSHLLLRPQIAEPHSLCFSRTLGIWEPRPLPRTPLRLSPKPQKGPRSAWLFLSQELSQGESSMVPEPKHGTVSLWKTSSHGEGIQGIFFGSWLGALNFSVSLTNLSGFQSSMCCFFIGIKATLDYASGLDIGSGFGF